MRKPSDVNGNADVIAVEKNAVLEILQKNELGSYLARFVWSTQTRQNGELVPTLSCQSGGHSFFFEFNHNSLLGWGIRCFPDPKGGIRNLLVRDWNSVKSEIKRWAETVKRELNTPDLWEQLIFQQNLTGFEQIDDSDFAPFTEDEQIKVREVLLIARNNIIAQFALSDGDREFITDRFDYLAEALDRLNRYDWKGLLIGTAVSISINLAVDTNTGREIWNIIQQAFSSVLRLLTP